MSRIDIDVTPGERKKNLKKTDEALSNVKISFSNLLCFFLYIFCAHFCARGRRNKMKESPFVVTETTKVDTGKPVDYSFKKYKSLQAIGVEGARQSRIGKIPERGIEHKKFLTRSVWLNNNKLTSIKNMDALVNSILEQPDKLGWIDFSFNYITEIDDVILKYQNLKIVYFHGNQITDIEQVVKLRKLPKLRSVTFHGNPIADQPRYRQYVVLSLPQIVNLDFCPVVKGEKVIQPPPDLQKIITKVDGGGEAS